MNLKLANITRIPIRLPYTFRIGNRYVNSKRIDVVFIGKEMKPSKIDLRLIADEQEKAIDEVCSRLRLVPIQGITIRLHNQPFKTMFGSVFQGGGYANYYYRTIEYAISRHWFTTGNCRYLGLHEMVHLAMQIRMGFCRNKFLTEGFANAIDGWYGNERIEKLNESARVVGQLLSLRMLFEKADEIENDVLYPQSGMAIKWIISEYGMEYAKCLYRLGVESNYDYNKIGDITGSNYKELCQRYNNKFAIK
jgi:hypothetical protein